MRVRRVGSELRALEARHGVDGVKEWQGRRCLTSMHV